MYRSFKCRDTAVLCKPYATYVIPIIGSTVVWSNISHLAKNIELIESLQKHFTKLIPQFFNSDFSYRERPAILGLGSLEVTMAKIALYDALKMFYGHADLDVRNLFSFA